MTERDAANLSFLMSLDTREKWETWAKSVDQDDMNYASSLLECARLELVDQHVTNTGDYTEAFMLFEYIATKASRS